MIHYVSHRHYRVFGSLDDFITDERLGKQFKAHPPTEDVYVYQSNGPTFDSA